MKSVKFTMRIKSEHKPKEFRKGMGFGVLYVEVRHYTGDAGNIESPLFMHAAQSQCDEILREFIEVDYEVIDGEYEPPKTSVLSRLARVVSWLRQRLQSLEEWLNEK